MNRLNCHFPDSLNDQHALGEIMFRALVMERANFIELLVMNGFVMRSFLTVEKLRTLYNEAVSLIINQVKKLVFARVMVDGNDTQVTKLSLGFSEMRLSPY